MSATRQTAYRRRYKPAKGACLYEGVEDGPRRIMATLDADSFRRLAWLASKRQVPVTTVLRDAVWAYLLPIKADADAEMEST